MKKRAVVLILLLFLTIMPFVLAANETGYEKAYACLETQLGDDCAASASTEQAAFSLLAIAASSAWVMGWLKTSSCCFTLAP